MHAANSSKPWEKRDEREEEEREEKGRKKIRTLILF
jgi:hypothetical protein